MAVVKENNEISVVDSLLPSSPLASNKSGSDAASDTSSVGATDLSERIINDQSDSSSIQRSNKDVEIQSPGYLKSEEYRLLFRLPSDEVLVQDFNCAFQESILLQGHMYLFVHHICFYSNIFGFETKKAIPFDEVTCVRKAKTAAIFPNAIEIVCGVKRHFFASFLSRDEAYRLIVDGWSQHSGVQGLIDHEDTKSEIRFQDELGTPERLQSVNTPERLQSVNTPERLQSLNTPKRLQSVNTPERLQSVNTPERLQSVNTPERLQSVKPPSVILSSDDRNKDVRLSGEDKFLSNGKDDTVVSTGQSETQENGEDVEPVSSAESLSSIQPLRWKLEDADPPKVPEYYTKVAESKFPIQAEEFFNLFFSDAAANFIETFHGRCGDKDFRCSSWYEYEQIGQARDISFQHPIKLYFVAFKVQSLAAVRRFRNFEFTETVAAALHFAPATLSAALAWAVSIICYHRWHLVIETSQEVSDVPYADYFRVQGFWDVEEDGNDTSSSCILRVYVNVAFSKRTMWKGKIEQNTIDECRDAYALWLDDAHKLLKKKNLEKLEDTILIDNPIQNVILLEESDDIIEALSERFPDTTGLRIPSVASDSKDINSSVEKPVCPDPSDVTSTASLLKELFGRFCLYMKSRNHLPLIVVIASISILLLMQLSIIVLLSRTPQVHVVSQVDYMNSIGISGGGTSEKAEAVAWLEKRFHHLKDEMLMIETRLEKMRYEHTLLKSYLKGLEQLKDQNK